MRPPTNPAELARTIAAGQLDGTPRLAPEVARITGHPERTVRRWLKSEAAEPPPAPAAETRAFDVTQFTLLERKQILVNLLVEPTIALAEKEEGYAILFPPASPLRDRRLLKLVARTLGLPFVRPSA